MARFTKLPDSFAAGTADQLANMEKMEKNLSEIKGTISSAATAGDFGTLARLTQDAKELCIKIEHTREILAMRSEFSQTLIALRAQIFAEVKAEMLKEVDSTERRLREEIRGLRAGPPKTVAGGTGKGQLPEQLSDPYDVFVTDDGYIWVTESGNNRVQRWPFDDRAEKPLVVAGGNGKGNGLHQLDCPRGIDVVGEDVYVVDFNNSRIVRWGKGSKQGEVVAGGNGHGPGPTQLDHPRYAVVLREALDILVSDANNNRVVRWPQGATAGVVIIDKVPAPMGIQWLENEDILLCDGLHRVCLWSKDKEPVLVAGGKGKGSGADQLNEPRGICWDHRTGDVFVVDRDNYRVQRWRKGAGSGSMVAGTGTRGKGPTKLENPTGLFLRDGWLYVCEWGNHRVQKFPLD